MKDYLIAHDGEEQRLKEFLLANLSEALYDSIKASGKNISDCRMFIATEILRNKFYIRNGNCGITDYSKATEEWQMGQAMHYFEEDSIKKVSSFNMQVGPGNVDDLTYKRKPKAKAQEVESDVDVEEIKKQAIEEYKETLKQKELDAKKKKEEEKKKKEEAKKKAEEEANSSLGGLFDLL